MIPIVILTVVLLLSVLYQKKKFVTALLLTYMFIIIAFNEASPDLLNNMVMYENINSGIYAGYEPLYVLLMRLFNEFGLPFLVFRCIVSFIALFFLYKGIVRITNNINVALALLTVYPALTFASGLRSFIGFGVGIYAFSLLTSDESHATLKYCFLSLIATLTHYEYITLFIFVIIRIKINIRDIVVFFVVEIGVLLLYYKGNLYRIISRILRHQKVLIWFNPTAVSHPSIKVLLLVLVFILATLYLVQNKIKNHAILTNKYLVNSHDNVINKAIYYKRIILLLLLFLPLLAINFTFERLLIVPLSVSLIFITNKLSNKEKKITVNSILHPSVLFSCDIMPIIIAVGYNLVFPTLIHGSIFYMIITNNMLL